MLWFKRCPRCGGDLHNDRDIYGHYVACLQCGYYLPDAEMALLIDSAPSARLMPRDTAESERAPALAA